MGSGLGASANECDDLIAELPLAHAGAGHVLARGQQQREHIRCLARPTLPGVTPCRDDLLHEGIVDGHGASKLPVARGGDPERGIRMKLSINSRRKFNGFVLLAQALPQYLCCRLSFS